MDSLSANDWTARELSELAAFFAWMDALCAEARQQGHKAPWPTSEAISEALNYWISDFSRGLTPAQALDNYNCVDSAHCEGQPSLIQGE